MHLKHSKMCDYKIHPWIVCKPVLTAEKDIFSNIKKVFPLYIHTILPPPRNMSFITRLLQKWRMQLLSKPLKNLLVLKLQLGLAIVWLQGFSFCPELIEGLVIHLCSYFRSEHAKYRENHRQVSTSIKKKIRLE